MLSLSTETSAIETLYDEPQTFLDDLTTLETEGYALRGVENSSFHAQASAFRSSKINDNRNEFPISYRQILSDWFYQPDIVKICYPYTENLIKKHSGIFRLFNLLNYLQVCNYLFAKYKENNPHHVFEKDRRQLEDRGSIFWARQNTFYYMVEHYFPLILTKETLDKSWRKEGYIDNIVTGFDMSFPQHYGTSTAALDFTKKTWAAIYFAIESHFNIAFNKECGLYVADKTVDYNGMLSIYAIKITNESSSCPIRIESIDDTIPNQRAKNQEGILAYFTQPCTYYMEYGRFPKIEDYLKNGRNPNFIFKKLSLRKSIKNLDFLSEYLTKKNITKDFIYPPIMS